MKYNKNIKMYIEENKMLSSLRLASKTLIGKEESKKIKNILQSLKTSNDSIQFRAPVDWKTLNLLDYCIIIKNPMDLGTIQRKFNEEKYIYVQEILDDIQLIWDNCKVYNHPETWIYNLAEKLERSFKKMVRNYLPHISITVPGKNGMTKQDKKISQISIPEQEQKGEVSFNEKTKLAEKLKFLSPLDLGHIIERLMQICPSVFSQTGDDTADLILDNIDKNALRQVNILIQDILAPCEDKISKKIKI